MTEKYWRVELLHNTLPARSNRAKQIRLLNLHGDTQGRDTNSLEPR